MVKPEGHGGCLPWWGLGEPGLGLGGVGGATGVQTHRLLPQASVSPPVQEGVTVKSLL